MQQMTRQQRRRCFAHAGIVAATSAILEDLKVNGMLSRLLRHETERKADEQRAEEAGVQGQQSSAQSAGTIMQELLDKQVWGTRHCDHISSLPLPMGRCRGGCCNCPMLGRPLASICLPPVASCVPGGRVSGSCDHCICSEIGTSIGGCPIFTS